MRDRLPGVLERLDAVTAAYLHGSRARGQAREGSDLDLGLLLQETPEDPLASQLLAERIERELDLPAGTVDVQVLNDASPRFLYQVFKHGDLVFERDPNARVAFETRALALYYDFLPMKRVQDRARQERFRGRA